MSSRMFPCSTISVVVLPAMPICLSAGWMSFASTASKSTPAFVPKGRMMKARVMARARFDPPMGARRGRSLRSAHGEHMADEFRLLARVRRAIAAEPRAELDLDALVFARQLRIRAQSVPESKVVAPLATVELDEVDVMGTLDAFLEGEDRFRARPNTRYWYPRRANDVAHFETIACAGIATAISSIGFAMSPGTAVLPTCCTSSASSRSASRRSVASMRNRSAQSGVYSRSRTVPSGSPRTLSPVRGSRKGDRSMPADEAPGNAICISCRFGTR